jgi:phenylpropionate dioxygenase-like ring-hydroxylating dioxygenase large terminal subunit
MKQLAADDETLRRLLSHVREKSTDLADDVLTVPAEIYCSSERADHERRVIFGRSPLVVGYSGEIANPGDYIVLHLPLNDVIVVRQRDGGVRALVNSCAHRGARLVDEREGTCNAFACPYHGWTYGIDGRLRTLPFAQTFGDIDRRQFGLTEVPVEERHGILWVLDDPDGQLDVASWLSPELDAALGDAELTDLVTIRRRDYDLPVNWKIMADGFNDTYHPQFLHAETIGPYVSTNMTAVRAFGPHALHSTADRKFGAILREQGDATVADMMPFVRNVLFLMPATVVVFFPDHVESFAMFPDRSDPCRSALQVRLLTPGERAVSQDWEARHEKSWKILLRVLEEDLTMSRHLQTQLGNRSAPGVNFGRHELLNQLFHRSLQRALTAASTS